VWVFFSVKTYAQTSDYIVTTAQDTIHVDKFDIKSKKVKVKINDEKKMFSYEALTALYDAKRKKHFEKISPVYLEYKGPSGKTFFAERLTKGKVKLYKCLMNQVHMPITSEMGIAGGGGSNFFAYYIGLEGSNPEMLCFYEIEMSKAEYKLYKLYLHSNEEIQKEMDELYFSEMDKKEKAVIDLVKKYNQWWTKSN
jgi:hypothetical protein